MKRVCPEWVRVLKASTLKADFELAVQNIDNALFCTMILEWLEEAMEGEEPTSLRYLFRR
jgi:hypothetical protein